MTALRLMANRHSVFYSPLIGGIAGGFFKAEGFEPTYSLTPAGRTVGEMIASGDVDVSQTAVSASWALLEKAQKPPFLSFAQINQRDGFVVAARRADPDFRWEKLLEGSFMFVHGGQPQAMLTYALHQRGIDISKITALNSGGTEQMMRAFRAGQGDYFHEQGPYPQQLEHEGIAHVVASVGEVIGPVAFSSLAGSPEWLKRPEAKRFLRAYRRARTWVNTAPAGEIAAAEQSFFPNIHRDALTKAIAHYQRLGCWEGDVAIAREHYEAALDVFAYSKLITRRHSYEQVVAAPPDT